MSGAVIASVVPRKSTLWCRVPSFGMLHTMLQVALVLVGALGSCSGTGNGSRHAFYRSMWRSEGTRSSGGSRRVFGGVSVPLSTFPGTCALLDRYWTARCSAAVVAPYWAVTAAHCVSPKVAYVKYNTRRPTSDDGVVSAVIYMYAHPGFKVLEQNEGRGLDVTQLHHDVGLVHTDSAMWLRSPPALQPIIAMRLYDLETLHGQKVQGEELFEAQLRLVACERASWEHCVCGVGDALSGPGARGVCSGDSGGPVLYRGAQVGVTSMGPIECATGPSDPSEGATSVFTALYPYVQMLNSTMHNTESVLRMRRISASGSASRSVSASAYPTLIHSSAAAIVLLAATALFERRAR